MCTPGYVLDVCAKNEGDRAYGLEGVIEQTHTHTDRAPYAINDIDILNYSVVVINSTSIYTLNFIK